MPSATENSCAVCNTSRGSKAGRVPVHAHHPRTTPLGWYPLCQDNSSIPTQTLLDQEFWFCTLTDTALALTTTFMSAVFLMLPENPIHKQTHFIVMLLAIFRNTVHDKKHKVCYADKHNLSFVKVCPCKVARSLTKRYAFIWTLCSSSLCWTKNMANTTCSSCRNFYSQNMC